MKKKNKGVKIKFTLTTKQSDEIKRLRRRFDMQEIEYTNDELEDLIKWLKLPI